MSTEQATAKTATIDIENIGGIEQRSIELSPGVTIISGRNATNRTSFLQAIMAVCGSDQASLKADADRGSATLAIDGQQYVREYTRRNGTIITDGDPCVEDTTLADLFAFLVETNEARQAVARGDDLRELMMQPVDTDRIEAEVQRLETEREDVDARLEELTELKRRLPDIEDQRQETIEEIQATEAELAEVEAEIQNLDEGLEATREETSELDELSDVRAELRDVRTRIGFQQESIESLTDERAELEAEREEYSRVPEERIEEIDAEIRSLRGRIREVDQTIDELASIIRFNEDMVDESRPALGGKLGGADGASGDGQEQLTCWTCGSEVAVGGIESTLDQLRDLRSEKLDRRNELDEELDAAKTEKLELTERNRQHDQIERSVEQIDRELEERTERVDEFEDRREELSTRVEELEEVVEEKRTDDYGEVLDVHKEANRLEFELERVRDRKEQIEHEIERIETELAERETLEARRAEIAEELTELRTRVEQLEGEAITRFNEHMDSILELLEYDNLERIWIDRSERSDGREPSGPENQFDLHVVRSTDAGSVYEDTIDHLSESEREVTGVVFALAGYLVHEVHEELPFMLLDSVEAIDADRIARLVEYVSEYPDYLVVALLEEDAAALDEGHERISAIR